MAPCTNTAPNSTVDASVSNTNDEAVAEKSGYVRRVFVLAQTAAEKRLHHEQWSIEMVLLSV